MADLQTPPTEAEIAEAVEVLNRAGLLALGLHIRRLAYQRDRLQAEIERLQGRDELLVNSLSFMTNALDPAQSEETADWVDTDVRWRLRIDGLHAEIKQLKATLALQGDQLAEALTDQQALAEDVKRLQAIVKERETGLDCLRGLQKAGDDMRDDLQREWKKSEDEVGRLQGIVAKLPKYWRLKDNKLI